MSLSSEINFSYSIATDVTPPGAYGMRPYEWGG